MQDLDRQMEALRSHSRYAAARSRAYDIRGDEGTLIEIPGVSIPAGWSAPSVDLAFWVSRHFPSSPPSCFWTAEPIWLQRERYGNMLPQWTQRGHQYIHYPQCQTVWWHWTPAMWSPNGDTLLTYAHFCRRRFEVFK